MAKEVLGSGKPKTLWGWRMRKIMEGATYVRIRLDAVPPASKISSLTSLQLVSKEDD